MTLFSVYDYSVAKATRHHHPVTLLLVSQTKNISAAHVKCLFVSCFHNENFEMKCTFQDIHLGGWPLRNDDFSGGTKNCLEL